MSSIAIAYTPTATATGIQIPVITTKEVNEAIQARENYLELNRAKEKAEKEQAAKLMVIFTKAFGIKTLDEIKTIPPGKLLEKFNARIKNKDVIVDSETKFAFLKTSSGVRPSWKDEFQERLGDVVMAEVIANTKETFSYAISKV